MKKHKYIAPETYVVSCPERTCGFADGSEDVDHGGARGYGSQMTDRPQFDDNPFQRYNPWDK